ncbi:MAG TPA: hypothetical protein VEW42_01545 [Candidatus Eisenbacteria bacterium]|nr:hypothetical protein [Candidatus Eisenbacteria bacterium]
MKKIIVTVLLLLGLIPVLLFVVKGDKGNPIYYQKERDNKFGGPFELSISAGRFALTESIVKYHSLFIPLDLAKFSSPDVAEYKGNYISLFTPGVSFLGIPFYMLGEPFGTPQLSAYFLNVVIALINVFLIAKLSTAFGAKYKVGLLGGVIFLLATNSLAYTSTFTQHHATIMLLLSMLIIALKEPTLSSYFALGTLYGFGLMIDVPNVFILFPIVLYGFFRSIDIKKISSHIQISFKTPIITLFIGTLTLFLLFGYYNYLTTGSYTKIAQFIGQTERFKTHLPPSKSNVVATTDNVNDIKIGLKLPFKTRSELFGMYILLFSDERSWIFYCPVVLIGFLGILLAYRKAELRNKTTLIVSVILTNILLYSMFGDPWGGWAFGSRYLLPSAALLCALLTVAITRYRRNILFLLVFSLLTLYSLKISLLGALTTIAIPPKIEAIHLINPVPYTSQYNQNLINANYTSSLFYRLFLSKIVSVKDYFLALYSYSALVIAALLTTIIWGRKNNNE